MGVSNGLERCINFLLAARLTATIASTANTISSSTNRPPPAPPTPATSSTGKEVFTAGEVIVSVVKMLGVAPVMFVASAVPVASVVRVGFRSTVIVGESSVVPSTVLSVASTVLVASVVNTGLVVSVVARGLGAVIMNNNKQSTGNCLQTYL